MPIDITKIKLVLGKSAALGWVRRSLIKHVIVLSYLLIIKLL